jgi:hypothetical protein
MLERCKHDMLPGYCGYCRLLSSDAAQAAPMNGHDVVAWLGRLGPVTAQPAEPSLPKHPTNCESLPKS